MPRTDRNLATGFGLSLVAGLPLPPSVTEAALTAQARIEAAQPGRFIWYRADQLHITVRALLRTRYREAPALLRSELPAELDAFLADLEAVAGASPTLLLRIGSPRIIADNHAQAPVHIAGVPDWWTRFRRYPELDDEAERAAFHISLGFARPGEAVVPRGDAWDAPALPALGECALDTLWIVHYANRTLGRLCGRVPAQLGRRSLPAAAQFLTELGIGDDAPAG